MLNKPGPRPFIPRFVLAIGCATALFNTGLLAAPFIPQDDGQVLEWLPFKPGTGRQLRQQRMQLAEEPVNLALAVSIAKNDITQARREGDPRFLGYAQAALAHWWNMDEAPIEVALLRAAIRQSTHDFSGALNDLAWVLRVQPDHAQGRLLRALILQVQGDYAGAKRDCLRLLRIASELVAVTCVSGVASLNGNASKAYDLLARTVRRYGNANPEEKLWSLTTLAEIAARTGNIEDAEKRFRDALFLDRNDVYLLGAYADFLLVRGKARAVIDLLQEKRRVDPLLLRTAVAEQALDEKSLPQSLAILRERFNDNRLRGDTSHRREEARFYLTLLHEPREALSLARANWKVQREPADARILLEAAIAANDAESAGEVAAWIAQTRLEDVQLSQLTQRMPGK